MSRLVLPIGDTRVKDKRPEVIAALVASELLQCLLGQQASHVPQPQTIG